MSEPTSNQPQLDSLNRIQILTAMGITAIALLLVSRVWIFFSAVNPLPMFWASADLLLGIAIGLGVTVASSLVYLIWPQYRRSADFYLHLILKPLAWVDLIWLGLLPGLSEELLFRGVVLPTLGFNTPALLVSSLFFGVLHFSGSQQWAYVIWATVIGIVLGLSALATGNLLVPIVAHIVTNLVSSYIWKFRTSQA